MTIAPVSFELSLDRQQRARLSSWIRYYFINAIDGTSHIFDDVDKAIQILSVLNQIQKEAITIYVSRYQVELLLDVIYDREKRWNAKTDRLYLPKDFDNRDIYDALKKLTERKVQS
jgi:hypothetical protein